DDERELLASNDVFPFNFTSNPATVTLSVSFPLFNGFTRERQVQEARSAAEDARHRRRAEELARRTAAMTRVLRGAARLLHLPLTREAVEEREAHRERHRGRVARE